MTDATDKLIDAAVAMHPLTRSWLLHGAVIVDILTIVDADDLSERQREDLAEACHTWGELLMAAGLLWWDARDGLRDEEAAA